jgi:hypothetical protein
MGCDNNYLIRFEDTDDFIELWEQLGDDKGISKKLSDLNNEYVNVSMLRDLKHPTITFAIHGKDIDEFKFHLEKTIGLKITKVLCIDDDLFE